MKRLQVNEKNWRVNVGNPQPKQPPQRVQPQRVELYQPMMAARPGPAPLVLRVGVSSNTSISEGVPAASTRVEAYVLLSALPVELRQRVELAVQMLVSQQ